ncbi:MAG: cytosolic protein [Parcubacteria group bacterium CG10_big_fil_rev_8_21_14_0_10_35_15]|nr:MAG: cytosolic protein [Parcubacteria group bacterium CG10_big_fil_rev_8_21_14_0_10_35_15]
MKNLNYEKLNTFIASDVIKPFYEIRLSRLESAKLSDISKRKNPYLFKAKNIETAGDLAKSILDAFLSSQEETIFGDLMENLAIHVCREVFNGKKAEEGIYRSVDLIFERDGKTYVVGIKSGPNWGNSDQVNTMRKNLRNAKKLLRAAGKKDIVSVNGCMYGRDNVPHKVNKNPDLSYYKICGQAFWELISGDDLLYKKIIQPLDKEAKKRDEVFKTLYVKKINEMTKDVVDRFYTKDNLDWDKIIDYVSKK